MSLINEFRSTQAAIEELQKRLEALKQDERLQQEIEFEKAVRDAMAKFGKTEKDVLALFAPAPVEAKAGKKVAVVGEAPARRTRTLKKYKNPHDGSVIETKGGNHKLLKEWKAKYGADVVEGWIQG
ncbi:histone-like nucleoid-structuring protein, MvaT/MvaU family [Geopseudomonas aromaticivorans]